MFLKLHNEYGKPITVNFNLIVYSEGVSGSNYSTVLYKIGDAHNFPIKVQESLDEINKMLGLDNGD